MPLEIRQIDEVVFKRHRLNLVNRRSGGSGEPYRQKVLHSLKFNVFLNMNKMGVFCETSTVDKIEIMLSKKS